MWADILGEFVPATDNEHGVTGSAEEARVLRFLGVPFHLERVSLYLSIYLSLSPSLSLSLSIYIYICSLFSALSALSLLSLLSFFLSFFLLSYPPSPLLSLFPLYTRYLFDLLLCQFNLTFPQNRRYLSGFLSA